MPFEYRRTRTRQRSEVFTLVSNGPTLLSGTGTCSNVSEPKAQTVQVSKVAVETIKDNPQSKVDQHRAKGLILPVTPMLQTRDTLVSELAFIVRLITFANCICNGGKSVTQSLYRREWIKRLVPNSTIRAHHPEAVSYSLSCAGQLLKQAQADALSGDFDLLTTIGELKETAAYIGDKFSAVSNATKAFRSAVKGLKSGSKEYASRWLEYRYGVMPLVYSISDLAEILRKNMKWRQRGYAAVRNIYTDKGVVSNGEYFLRPEFPIWKVVYERTTQLECHAMVMSEADIKQLLYTLQINPLVTAWELVKLSFVLDWFIDVGDTLASYDAVWNPDVVARSFSRKLTTTVKYSVIGPTGGYVHTNKDCMGLNIPYNYSIAQDIPFNMDTLFTYERYPAVSSDVAVIPQFRVKLNWKRVLDAISLLRVFKKA